MSSPLLCTKLLPSQRIAPGLTLLAVLLLGLPLAAQAPGSMITGHRIAEGLGGFSGPLDSNDMFGDGLAAIGDVDGDGIDDLAVGAIGDDDGKTVPFSVTVGAVYILFLNADGTVRERQKISLLEGGFTGPFDYINEARFGRGLAGLGDLDLDGVPDIAVGAYLDGPTSGPSVLWGTVWVLFLNSDGTVKSQVRLGNGTGGIPAGTLTSGSNFGRDVDCIGDLDGDGVADLVVGASNTSLTTAGDGAVWILFMNTDGTVKDYRRISEGESGFTGDLDVWDNFGNSVASLGDLDGDGVVDLAVGTELDDDGGADRGAVYILFMNTDGTVKTTTKISDAGGGMAGGLIDQDWFGAGLEALPDLDGDGVRDLAVGATGDGDDTGTHWALGAVWILFMNTDGTVKGSTRLDATATGGWGVHAQTNDRFGTNVAWLGDLDGNGVGTLAVGNLMGLGTGAVSMFQLVSGVLEPAWVDVGHALAGVYGEPVLSALGSFFATEMVSIRLAGARENAPAFLFVAETAINQAMLGGTMVPGYTPPAVIVPFPTDGVGSAVFSGSWPTGLPAGFEVFMQTWIADPAAPFGWSASNAIHVTPP